MGCCKCEEYGWDDPQPELNGTGYCIFHAPPEGKTVDNDEFNRRVFAHINNARAADKTCHLSGTEFPCAINFRHPSLLHPLPQIILTESTFHGTASFKSTQFSKNIDFINTTFKGHVSFDNSTFEKSFSIYSTQFDKECSFRHTAFNGNTTFDNVYFKHTSNFDSAKFNEYTRFSDTKFMSNSVFQHSQFEGITIFTDVTFNNDIVFNNATFSKRIAFENVTSSGDISFTKSKFFKNASFTKTLIKGSATFQSITANSSFIMKDVKIYGDTTFKNATFQGPSLYITVELSGPTSFENALHHSTTTFHGVKIYGTSSFNRSIFKECTNFSHVLFAKHAKFDNFTISKSSEFCYVKFFKGGSFSTPSFLERVIFSNCTFASTTTFTKPLTLTDLRFVDSDLYHVDFLFTNINHIQFLNVCWPIHDVDFRYSIPSEHCVKNLKAVSEFYCQMKKRNRDEQNDAEASLWHYAEKEVQLKLHSLEKPYSFQRFMLEIYRLISRYGEDPWQAFRIFFYLLVGLFFSLCLGSLPYFTKYPVDITWSNVAGFFHCFFQYALLDKPTYQIHPGFAALALFFSRLLIPIQAAIFAFALRNKLHR